MFTSTEGGGVPLLLKLQGKSHATSEMIETNPEPHLGLRGGIGPGPRTEVRPDHLTTFDQTRSVTATRDTLMSLLLVV